MHPFNKAPSLKYLKIFRNNLMFFVLVYFIEFGFGEGHHICLVASTDSTIHFLACFRTLVYEEGVQPKLTQTLLQHVKSFKNYTSHKNKWNS